MRFLELLKDELDSEPLPLLKQAENWRASTREVKNGAEEATKNTATTIQKELPAALEKLDPRPSPNPPDELPPLEPTARRVVAFEFRGERWEIVIELTNNSAVGPWLEIAREIADGAELNTTTRNKVGMRLSLAHPFMVKFAGTSAEQIEPLLRVAAALALAEHFAYAAAVRNASTVRSYVNDLLREALAREN